MSHAKIRNIFNTVLLEATQQINPPSFLSGLRIAFDNVPFEPETDETYLHAHLIPADTLSSTLSGDHREYIGLYQVTVFTASGEATLKSDSIIDDLSDLFMLYKPFTNDEKSIMVQPITPVKHPQGTSQDNWWKIPCWFQYRADTNSPIYIKEP